MKVFDDDKDTVWKAMRDDYFASDIISWNDYVVKHAGIRLVANDVVHQTSEYEIISPKQWMLAIIKYGIEFKNV